MARRATVVVMAGLLSWSTLAVAQQPSETTDAADTAAEEDNPQLLRARKLYLDGVTHVRQEEWADGLVSFEASAKLRAHPITTFNIAVCQRALGQYTKAGRTLDLALEQAHDTPGQLPKSLESEAEAMRTQIRGLLASVEVTLEPASARIAVDGRPLSFSKTAGKLTALAGVEEAGPGRTPPSASFRMVLNPGPHVITLSRKGFTDAVVNRSFAPGSKTSLPLELSKLPATLSISSNVEGAIVRVSGVDMGPTPVDVLRPAGSYDIVVSKDGYQPYESRLFVRPGEVNSVRASLRIESTPITSRWWFWAGAAAVVAGGVLTTYALTRPDPSPPPYDGGNTGWVVRPAGASF